jgi:hypothetical protein
MKLALMCRFSLSSRLLRIVQLSNIQPCYLCSEEVPKIKKNHNTIKRWSVIIFVEQILYFISFTPDFHYYKRCTNRLTSSLYKYCSEAKDGITILNKNTFANVHILKLLSLYNGFVCNSTSQ